MQLYFYNLLVQDGSLSDTALGTIEPEPVSDDALLKAEPRDYFGPGMGKKSNSTSQLSATGENNYQSIPHFYQLSVSLDRSMKEQLM